MPSSKVNPKYQFDSGMSVVSLLCTELFKPHTPFGHAVIVVESIVFKDNKKELFVGQYELARYKSDNKESINDKGVVTVIRGKGKNKYHKNAEEYYSKAHKQSWYAKPEAVEKMIESIKKDISDVKLSLNGEKEMKSYQAFGSTWRLYGGNGGHNCVTWAEEKMAVANVGNGIKLLESSAPAFPLVHIYPKITKLILLVVTTGSVLAITSLKNKIFK